MKEKLILVLFALIITAFQVKSQENDNRIITQIEQKDIIGSVSDRFEKAYIYPEKVKEIKEFLYSQFESGKYCTLLSASAYAQQLDKDIQFITSDKHAGISYDPKMANEILSEKNQTYYTQELIGELSKTNFGFTEMKILEGNIGYMDLREFCPAKYAGNTAVAAMNYFANCDALIIDLRYNGGGDESMVQFLTSYFFDTADTTITFFTSYNRLNNTYFQSSTFPYVPGEKLYKKPLYILISKSTFSAAEAFAYNLQTLKRAVIVGENSRGGENPVEIQVVMNDFVVYIPAWKIVSSLTKSETRWEGTGIKPDIGCSSEMALEVAHIESLKDMMKSTTHEQERFKLQWAIDGVIARQIPIVINEKRLKLFIGIYGNYNISFKDGHLLYQRGDRAKMRMNPISTNTFMIEKLENVRLRFVEEKGSISSVEILFDDGRVKEFTKENPIE